MIRHRSTILATVHFFPPCHAAQISLFLPTKVLYDVIYLLKAALQLGDHLVLLLTRCKHVFDGIGHRVKTVVERFRSRQQ